MHFLVPNKYLYFSCLLLVMTLGTTLAQAPKPAMVPAVDFNRDIRPILTANCFACHGQDSTARQAGLRLDTREGAVALRNGSRAIEAGRPDRSPLVARVNTPDSALVMPPVASGRKLTAEQKRLLTLWVQQGAPYAAHWSYARLVRPATPAVKNRAWAHSPLDAFVLARLEKAGLTPAAEADRYTLIRRLALDLTGLPPASEEVQRFVQDRSSDSNAYEKAVDRLLASPRYGEHWARLWLDLARYADSQGYEKDQPRTMWRYRDWVIDAFNADMPFDQFTVEQIAGDLLPHPTSSQILATAFHRNTMTNTEGGVDQEEFRTAAVKDRVDTTVQVWMGLTMGCAKCHSHKYDPITQQEYYKFYALFNQTADANYGDDSPKSPMPTDAQQQQQSALQAKVKAFQETLARHTPERDARQREWERTLPASAWTPLALVSATASSGATFKTRQDSALLVSGNHADKDTYTLTFNLPQTAISAIRLEALKDPSLPNGGPGREVSDQNVVTSEFQVERIASNGTERKPIPLQNPRADFEQGGWPIAAAIDGKEETGWAFSPQNKMPHVAIFDLKQPLGVNDNASGSRLVVTIRQNYPRLQHGCLRISVTGANPAVLKPELHSLAEVASIPAAQRTAEQQKRLDDAFSKQDAATAVVYKNLEATQKELMTLEGKIARIPITQELAADRQRVTRIHQRGNFMDPGEVVTPDVPAAFGPLPASAPHNRLGAAQWLVAPDNSLTPRVAVNRFWARLFGTGLVETEEDFGTQGTPPTNPALLDWLAVTFRDDLHWSIKRLCKTIVMSATYRQASQPSPLAKKLDPRNQLFSRGPRFRLTAEMVRDQALAVSGLLSPKLKGPSVMPPQPEGIWHTVYSGMKWETSAGEDRYRRALYTYWRRSNPYPAMMTFDAGSGEYCVVRRIRTNTPLQALVTLNDPAFVEAAGALGKAMLAEPATTPKARLIYGFRRVLMRPPTDIETARLVRLYTEALTNFRTRPEADRSLLTAANIKLETRTATSESELAACTLVANVLLNLDETLTKP